VKIFNEWAIELQQQNSLRNWIAIDGKSLRSTINNYSSKSQNFVVIVSFFSQEFGLVLKF